VIENGVRHNQPGGWLRVALAERDGRAELTVENGGDVLDPGHVRDLAQPFRRPRADRTGSARGAGLGLSIVAAIATAHQGTLTLKARDEGGLQVLIELPQPLDAPRRRPPAPDLQPAPEADLPTTSGITDAVTIDPRLAGSGDGTR
jgi:signal transduction histidine kinase